MSFEIKTASEQETENLGEKLAKSVKSGDVIALFGELGAGKTAFTRGVARGLDCIDDVSSPTFALMNEYRGKLKLYHFDMYRINGFEELYCTGFFDYIEEDNVISLIEWSENIEDSLPESALKIRIEKLNDNSRIFKFEGIESL